MTKNAITKKETEAYRLCHHSFDGLPVCQAADMMGLSVRRVEQLLANMKEKAPQLFPILTPTQARDYHLYTVEGWSMIEIAVNTGRNHRTVSKSIAAAVSNGMPKPGKRGGVLRYQEGLDSQIKEKL